MKKYIPLWVKSPVSVFLHQIGRLPPGIVIRNIHWSFTQSGNCSDEFRERVHLKVQKTVYHYLLQKYGNCIDEICADGTQGNPVENAPIWVFWWQGEQNAPDIIKTCIRNIQKNRATHPVNVVDGENYQNFIQIPEHIVKKLKQGKISVTHLSDYLRMKLLAEHGGLWVDATVFVQKPLEEVLFQVPIWTVRNPGDDSMNISNWEWSINFMGGWKGNALFCAVAEVLERYWKDHDMVAAYFMTDCLIRVIYDRYEAIKNMIQAVPPSNGHYYYFLENFSMPLDSESYGRELHSDTWLYKVSWKGQYEERLPDGQETVYGRWKKDFGA